IFKTLRRFEGQVTWKRLELGKETDLVPGLSIRAFAVPGKLPVHLMGGARAASPEDNVGVVIREAESRVVYCASAGALGAFVDELHDCDALFFDGTFFTSDELVKLGLSKSRAEDMAHLPIGGETGS